MTGIAALLLTGGTTVHSRFGVPLELDEESTSSLPVQSDRAAVLRDASVVVLDEATMGNRKLFAVVDRVLKDIMRGVDESLGDVLFGGKIMVLSGDWRQLPPVVRHAGRAGTVTSCLKYAQMWQNFTVLTLTTNMRVETLGRGTAEAEEVHSFSEWLLDVGAGLDDKVEIPDNMKINANDLASLVQHAFPQLENESVVKDGCILTTLNKYVDDMNAFVLQDMHGLERIYKSADYFGPVHY